MLSCHFFPERSISTDFESLSDAVLHHLLEVDPGNKIPPEREFGNDPLWAVRFGNCRYGNFLVRTDSQGEELRGRVERSCAVE